MTVEIPVGQLHPAHRKRAERLRAEAEKLARWGELRRRFLAAVEHVEHGDVLALQLRLGAEMGMEERETLRALKGS